MTVNVDVDVGANVDVDTLNPIELITPEGRKTRVYAIEHLIKLRNIGMKFDPTFAYSAAFNHGGLISDEQFASSPICQNSVPRYLYLHPEFWTLDNIQKNHWRFEGVRCLPGKTYIYDDDGKIIGGPYRLFILDIDSEAAYQRCKRLLEDDWLKHTYVTKTLKEYGYHIYWLEDWDENDDVVGISHDDCKSQDSYFEIMVGIDYPQVLGHHRNDPKFCYKQVGCRDLKKLAIMIRNGLYNKLLEIFRDLLSNPEKINKRRKLQQPSKDPLHRNCGIGSKEAEKERQRKIPKSFSRILSDGLITAVALWAERFYLPSKRFNFMLPLLGNIARYEIDSSTVAKITDKIYNDTKDPDIANKAKWYGIYRDACDKLLEGGEVRGRPALVNWISSQYPKFTEEEVIKEVEDLISLLKCANGTEIEIETEKETDPTKINANEEELIDSKLAKEVLATTDIDFVISTMTKEAECDEKSIRQLFHAFCSAFTKLPMPHSVNSMKAGAGKNHIISILMKHFPERYILPYSRMSDKALFHMPGIGVIVRYDEDGHETTIPIDPMIADLVKEKVKLEESNSNSNNSTNDFKTRIQDIEREIKDLQKQAEKLIVVDNSVHVMLDTPDDKLLEALMSLLSQDTPRDQKYIFADKTTISGLGTKFNRLRGTPCIIQSRVVDNTRAERFDERNRRFVHVNPDTSAKKIRAANRVSIAKYGSLPEEYDQEVVSRADGEKARRIIRILVAKLKQHSKTLKAKESGVFIPSAIRKAIEEAIPCKDGQVWAMTIADRLMKYLAIIAKENMDNRPKIVDVKTGQFRVIATFKDLREALDLGSRFTSSVRPYQADWFNKQFIRSYDSRQKPNECIKSDKGKEYLVKEDRRGVTTRQILDDMKEAGEPIYGDNDWLRRQYIYPLINAGLISSDPSIIDGKAQIYFPTDEDSPITLFVEENDFKLPCKPEIFPTKAMVQKSIEKALGLELLDDTTLLTVPKGVSQGVPLEGIATLPQYRSAETYVLKIHDEQKISAAEICDLYYCNAATCFECAGDITNGTVKNEKNSRMGQVGQQNNENGTGGTVNNGGGTVNNGESDDIRNNHIYELNKEGKSYREIAKLVNISKSTVERILKNRLREGSVDQDSLTQDVDLDTTSIRYRPDVIFYNGKAGLVLNQWPIRTLKNNSERNCQFQLDYSALAVGSSQVGWYNQTIECNSLRHKLKIEILRSGGERKNKNLLLDSSSFDTYGFATMVTAAAATILSTKAKASSRQQLVVVEKPRPSTQQQQQQQQPSQPPLSSLIPIPASLIEKVPALGKFAVFDSEWYREDLLENRQKGIAGDIYAFSLVDGHGSIERLHVDQFADRREFMSTILDILGRYDTLAGYAILNNEKNGFISDLGHIRSNCKQIGLYDRFSSIRAQVLDVYRIYHNEAVNGFLRATYKVSYRGDSLDAVTKAFLGKGTSLFVFPSASQMINKHCRKCSHYPSGE